MHRTPSPTYHTDEVGRVISCRVASCLWQVTEPLTTLSPSPIPRDNTAVSNGLLNEAEDSCICCSASECPHAWLMVPWIPSHCCFFSTFPILHRISSLVLCLVKFLPTIVTKNGPCSKSQFSDRRAFSLIVFSVASYLLEMLVPSTVLYLCWDLLLEHIHPSTF